MFKKNITISENKAIQYIEDLIIDYIICNIIEDEIFEENGTFEEILPNYDKKIINQQIKELDKKSFIEIKAFAEIIETIIHSLNVTINKNAYNLVKYLISLEKRKDIVI